MLIGDSFPHPDMTSVIWPVIFHVTLSRIKLDELEESPEALRKAIHDELRSVLEKEFPS